MNKENNTDEKPLTSYIFQFVYTIALALVIGFGYFYWDSIAGFFRGAPSGHTAGSTQAGDGNQRKVKYWRAPMDPSFTSDKPGKSPMGMELIPVYEDEIDDSGMIKISPAVVQKIGVRTAVARKIKMSRTIRTVGLVTYDERKLAKLQSKVSGWVEKLYINETGQDVKKDTILLEIYSPDLVTTQEEFILAMKYKKSLEKSHHKTIQKGGESLLETARRKLELFDVPHHQIVELERTGKVKKTLHIHSPADGVVIKKNIIEGMYVKPGYTLYEIADLRKVWVNVDIYEYELPGVKVGQDARMTLASFPGRVFEGKITYVYPFLDVKSRTVKVRLEFDNRKGELKPDMYGDVIVDAGKTKQVVAIPTESILRSGTKSVVFISKGEGTFEPREVSIGLESEGMTEILSGVKDGETVVTSSQFLLDSESKLREVVSKMTTKPQKESRKPMKMDHSKMKNPCNSRSGEMDHSKMDHSGMSDGAMNHSKMDHSGMGNGAMNHSKMDHSGMGNGAMNHSKMDHSGMSNGAMNHSKNQ